MLQGLLSKNLDKLLNIGGKPLLKNFDRSLLSIALWKGDIILEDVEVNVDAFNSLLLPFALCEAYLGRLSIKIPWNRLYSKPIVVMVDRVVLVAEHQDAGRWTPEALGRAREFLLRAMAMELDDSPGGADASRILSSPLLATILSNLIVDVRSIHVSYTAPNSVLPGAKRFTIGAEVAGVSLRSSRSSSLRPTAGRGETSPAASVTGSSGQGSGASPVRPFSGAASAAAGGGSGNGIPAGGAGGAAGSAPPAGGGAPGAGPPAPVPELVDKQLEVSAVAVYVDDGEPSSERLAALRAHPGFPGSAAASHRRLSAPAERAAAIARARAAAKAAIAASAFASAGRAGSTSVAASGAHQYVLHPLALACRLIAKPNARSLSGVPRLQLELEATTPLSVELSEAQLVHALSLLAHVRDVSYWAKMCVHRPRARATARPRAWWLYAGLLAKERARASRRAAAYDPWLELWALYCLERDFTQLCLRARTADDAGCVWRRALEPLSAVEKVRYAELERTLPLGQIAKLRTRASALRELASEKCYAVILPMLKGQLRRGGGSLVGGGSVASLSSGASAAAHATVSALTSVPAALHAPLASLGLWAASASGVAGAAASTGCSGLSGQGARAAAAGGKGAAAGGQPQARAVSFGGEEEDDDDDDEGEEEEEGSGQGGKSADSAGGPAAFAPGRRSRTARKRDARLQALASLPESFWSAEAVRLLLLPTRHERRQLFLGTAEPLEAPGGGGSGARAAPTGANARVQAILESHARLVRSPAAAAMAAAKGLARHGGLDFEQQHGGAGRPAGVAPAGKPADLVALTASSARLLLPTIFVRLAVEEGEGIEARLTNLEASASGSVSEAGPTVGGACSVRSIAVAMRTAARASGERDGCARGGLGGERGAGGAGGGGGQEGEEEEAWEAAWGAGGTGVGTAADGSSAWHGEPPRAPPRRLVKILTIDPAASLAGRCVEMRLDVRPDIRKAQAQARAARRARQSREEAAALRAAAAACAAAQASSPAMRRTFSGCSSSSGKGSASGCGSLSGLSNCGGSFHGGGGRPVARAVAGASARAEPADEEKPGAQPAGEEWLSGSLCLEWQLRAKLAPIKALVSSAPVEMVARAVGRLLAYRTVTELAVEWRFRYFLLDLAALVFIDILRARFSAKVEIGGIIVAVVEACEQLATGGGGGGAAGGGGDGAAAGAGQRATSSFAVRRERTTREASSAAEHRIAAAVLARARRASLRAVRTSALHVALELQRIVAEVSGEEGVLQCEVPTMGVRLACGSELLALRHYVQRVIAHICAVLAPAHPPCGAAVGGGDAAAAPLESQGAEGGTEGAGCGEGGSDGTRSHDGSGETRGGRADGRNGSPARSPRAGAPSAHASQGGSGSSAARLGGAQAGGSGAPAAMVGLSQTDSTLRVPELAIDDLTSQLLHTGGHTWTPIGLMRWGGHAELKEGFVGMREPAAAEGGRLRREWQRLYAVLHGEGVLSLFDTYGRRHASDMLPLRASSLGGGPGARVHYVSDADEPFTFALASGDRRVLICASSHQERADWVAQLRRAAQPPDRDDDEEERRERRAKAAARATAAAIAACGAAAADSVGVSSMRDRRRADSVFAALPSQPALPAAAAARDLAASGPNVRRALSDPPPATAEEAEDAEEGGPAAHGSFAESNTTRGRPSERASSADADGCEAQRASTSLLASSSLERGVEGAGASEVRRQNSGALRAKLLRSESARTHCACSARSDSCSSSPLRGSAQAAADNDDGDGGSDGVGGLEEAGENGSAQRSPARRSASLLGSANGMQAGRAQSFVEPRSPRWSATSGCGSPPGAGSISPSAYCGGGASGGGVADSGSKVYSCRLIEIEPAGGRVGSGELRISGGELRFRFAAHGGTSGLGGGADGGSTLLSVASAPAPSLSAFAALSVSALSSSLGLASSPSAAAAELTGSAGYPGVLSRSVSRGAIDGAPVALSSCDLVVPLSAIVRIEHCRALLVHRSLRVLLRERGLVFGGFASAAHLQQAADVLRTLSALAALRPSAPLSSLTPFGAPLASSVDQAYAEHAAGGRGVHERARRATFSPGSRCATTGDARLFAAAGVRCDAGWPGAGGSQLAGTPEAPPFELSAWLTSIGLPQYASTLREAGLCELELVRALTRADLRTCGIVREADVTAILSALDDLSRGPANERLAAERERVREWLASHELQQYAGHLLNAGFDSMAVVELMTVEDMVACGIDVPGHRRRLMKAVQEAAAAARSEGHTPGAGAEAHNCKRSSTRDATMAPGSGHWWTAPPPGV